MNTWGQAGRDGASSRGCLDGASFSIADSRAAGRLGHRVRVLLGTWRARPVASPAAELLTTIVSAAAPGPGRRTDVRLLVRDGSLRAEVSAPADPLMLTVVPSELARLCERWGCESTPSGGRIWFELPLPDGAGPAEPGEQPPPVRRPAGRPDVAAPRSQDRRRAEPPPVLPPTFTLVPRQRGAR